MSSNPKDKLQNFFIKYPLLRFSKNDLIARPTVSRDEAYYIEDGYVSMFTYFYEGKEFTLNIFKPGAYFPITILMSDNNDNNYYRAITNVTIHYAKKEEILKFLKENPDVLYQLTQRLSRGFHSFIDNISYILNGTAFEKIVYVLLLLCNRFSIDASKGGKRITLKLTHQDIANMANVSRETASTELKSLENEGIIHYKGGIFTILDDKKLADYLSGFEVNITSEEMKTI